MAKVSILILDFGGQYNHLIARRVRESGVYCEVHPFDYSIESIKQLSPDGIILTGGPANVALSDSPRCSPELFRLGIPVLGICYGLQLMCEILGGKVTSPEAGEYGRISLSHGTSPLFEGIPQNITTWMSHTNAAIALPEGFCSIAKTEGCENAAIESAGMKLYGVQFHPEVSHTESGLDILKNFLFNIAKCEGGWTMSAYNDTVVEDIRRTVGTGRVVLGLSGGVDSSVCAALISRAIGDQLTCIFVDHGLMRKNEGDEVEAAFKKNFNLNFVRIDARDRFLSRLEGVTDPERKRKIIGEEFIRVFEEAAKNLGPVDFLGQGTIYPDIIESGPGNAAVIKSHHNVGGLPDDIGFKGLVEPLRLLFKDEVRALGAELGLPDYLVWRQPFPGPGLGVRIIGEITREKIAVLQDADAIFREEVARFGLDRSISQYFAVLTSMRSVGVMGDERTYDYTLALRAVTTTDFMTADWARLPHELLERTANRIVGEVKHINRIVYDITTKPPATIEWE